MSENPAVDLWLFLSIGAVALFSFLSVMAWVDCRRREREAYYRSETLRKFAEMPGAMPAAVQEFMLEQEGVVQRQTRAAFRVGGLIVAATGIGIMLFLHELGTGPVYMAGVIPLLIGIAILVYFYLLAPLERR
ncbi:MAG TPA: hypothetical protein VHZ74_24270 [Bryobacteraceae bacterium]|jgi:hypothetical protein|nr:hypothetical protein [Bryobacteraceae bacterium]